jgi:diguanylate cyclase (GGDEF)-like protein
MERTIAGEARRPAIFALVLIDLDGFKQVNDTFGHDSGDAVLVEAAHRLSRAVRERDFVVRLGGDEFGIVLHGKANIEALDTICSRVVSGMTVPLMLGQGPVRIGASLGAALFPQHGATLDELYKRADLALYAAKRAGKGGWRWYEGTAA